MKSLPAIEEIICEQSPHQLWKEPNELDIQDKDPVEQLEKLELLLCQFILCCGAPSSFQVFLEHVD